MTTVTFCSSQLKLWLKEGNIWHKSCTTEPIKLNKYQRWSLRNCTLSSLRLSTGSAFCSKTGFRTFRSVLTHGKEQKPRKKIYNHATFMRGFDSKNRSFDESNSQRLFQMTLNARRSPVDSL